MYRVITTCFISFLLLVSCTQHSQNINYANNDARGNSIPFEVIAQNDLSGIFEDRPNLYQITDLATWEGFWGAHDTLNRPAPEIDFDEEMVLAIIDEYQPSSGYSLEIDRIDPNNNLLHVYVIRNQPGPTCFSASVITQPFIIIKLQKDTRMGELRLNSEIIECDINQQAMGDLDTMLQLSTQNMNFQ